MMHLSPEFSFSGTIDGPTGCEALVRAVRLRAFHESQLRDREWMAGYACTLFAGEALQWHARLPEEVQMDWRLLEQALMERYMPSSESGPSFTPPLDSSSTPGPSTTTRPPFFTRTTNPPAYDTLSIRSRHRSGYIRVLTSSTRSGGYLSRLVDSGKCHTITQWPDDAIRVQCAAAASVGDPLALQALKIVTPRTTTLNVPDEWLGVRWYDPNLKLPMSDHFAYVFRLTGPTTMDVSSTVCKGPIRANVWEVAADGGLTPCWIDEENNGARHSLEVALNNTSKRIAIVGDFNTFVGFNRAGYTKVRLVMELS